DRPTRSGLYIPIIADDRVIGVIALQSPQPRAFTSRQRDAIDLIASQAALGLYATQLYQRERQRAAQLLMIAEVSRRVAAILDLNTLFDDTVKLIRDTLGYYHVSIFTVDTAQQTVTLQASSSQLIRERGIHIPWGRGIIGHAAATGKSILANDVRHDERFLVDAALERTLSELAIPLKVENRILGVLDLQSDRTNAFSEQDVSILQILADQIAVAVEDSRLYGAEQEQAWIATALLQVAEAVAQHSTSEEIVEVVARLTRILVGVDRSLIFFWSDKEQSFILVEGTGLTREQMLALENHRFPVREIPLLDRIRREGRIIRGRSDDLVDLMPPPISQDPRRGELIAMPLQSQDQVIGILVAEDLSGRPISGPRETILTGIAHQATIALENAQLYASQREEAWVSTALLQVANLISNATYDLDETLSTVARLTPMLGGVAWAAILLWDGDRRAFVGAHSHGLPRDAAAMIRAKTSFPLKNSPALVRLLHGSDPLTFPVNGNETAGDWPIDTFRRLGPVTALPLRAYDRLMGALLVGHADPSPISGRRMNILTGIAHQAALAIETDRLYQRTVHQERLQHEIDLARRIQESFMPEECPRVPGWQIAVEWHAARGVGGDYYDFIRLTPNHLGLAIADVSDKGVAAALYMALSRTVLRATALDARGPAEALRRANRILLDDSRSGMFVSVFYAILDLRSGRLSFARAGHNPPLVVSARDRRVISLDVPGIVLGVIDNPELVEGEVWLEDDDMLLMYTDGVTEAINDQDEEFGEERLRRLLQGAPDHTAEEMVRLIDAAVQSFTGEGPRFDDLTLVAVRRCPDE
ncbi:MAG TPA: SpoIIE family protein phosphatase, partial [Chloroflexi bacterium]|nr:SpoIIE family protein phosphatase [Chloroflexota bacterium]